MKRSLIFIFCFFFKFLSAMPSAPQDMSQGQLYQPAPAQDQPMPQPQTTNPGQASASQGQPAVYDQLKWPDSVELNENDSRVVQSDDPKIVEFSRKASQIADQLKDITSKIKEATDKANQEMARINGVLDDFYQNIGFDEGKAEAMLK